MEISVLNKSIMALDWSKWTKFLSHPATKILSVLIPAAVMFAAYYLSFDPVPGNSADHPLGWWGWYDQSQYITASRNFQTGVLAPEAHVYPPLYPFIGAILIPFFALHSYLIPTIFLFSVYLLSFLSLFKNYLGWWGAAFAVILSLFLYEVLFLQWVIPWTSSLAATLQMISLLLFHSFLVQRSDPHWSTTGRVANAGLCALAVGLLAPTRPLDFIVFMPLLVVYFALVVKLMLDENGRNRRAAYLIIVSGFLGAGLPVILYLRFNNLLFGDSFGGYFALAQSAGGAAFSDLFDRSYSHLVDSETFYGESDADWMSKLPVLAFSLCFVPTALLLGNTFFRVLSLIVLLHLALVYSYADAVPTGQFRYFNIHYFKWMYPVLPVFFLILLRDVWILRGRHRNFALGKFFVGVSLAFGVASLEPRLTIYEPTSVILAAPGKIEIVFEQEVELDFIDVADLSAVIGYTNFWEQTVEINGGEPLRPISQVRLTPRPHGVRFLLTDTTRVSSINLIFSHLGELDSDRISVVPGRIALQVNPFASDARSLPPFPPAILLPGQMQDASNAQTSGRYLVSGWSGSEEWGRWMDGPVGALEFSLPTGRTDAFRLVIEGQGFLIATQTEVEIAVIINDVAAGVIKLDEVGPARFEIPLPQGESRLGGSFKVELFASSTLSPSQAGLNRDLRQLSFGLTGFGVFP